MWKKLLILMNRWFAGWETQFTPRSLERCVRQAGLEVKRTYGEWMVPGLWYRVTREVLKRSVRLTLPLEPRGPAWWSGAWDAARARLKRSRLAPYTCHVIGTVGVKP